jgi:hypothetical protein
MMEGALTMRREPQLIGSPGIADEDYTKILKTLRDDAERRPEFEHTHARDDEFRNQDPLRQFVIAAPQVALLFRRDRKSAEAEPQTIHVRGVVEYLQDGIVLGRGR